ncbi:DAK2 domain-containing protein [Atopobium sp. oral taxon 416]|jgi:dihydroxyacetone kinase-like protein|uniref:DAK2 domain-containing protein n=1 Tax=Atopobium sp. oral taxon 416 TaxID=712157 RepID=UPI001BA889C1|nr:DAK2 domain-containing protein [Atopobium sp. oral taxon 416]QUC03393.1 DAK2 domain-containing protein [Atopobium sp. oral taxon 416]
MQAGKALKGKPEVAPSVMVTYVEAFAEGIKKRGKCELGDRTILDSVDVAAEGARSLIDASFLKVMDTAVDGAKRL